ncbi:ketopantoate reductase family protein [Novosphingobium malaysiense]|uniref:Ketopantoate reductase N-terminal domain-containing protein n=1 Tax=Novosphingobium malaysiense TaxID=1348853 RepID=A0A0B1ZGM3_9SPHN|nr:2-dehydropantoate 2-reductase N-terminal domain-containing protein [Novosphingobium malaysiense]KHK90246.1 hypothetical protein LK12_16480 [Novosphingobium malaysiense]
MNPSVLIVGAGALGLVTGYHLALAGAQVTYLVRPNRMAALADPQLLYCYDDHQLKSFADYRACASVEDATQSEHDFVIVTMDGATCRGEEATALLRDLGHAIRTTNAIAVISGVGVLDYCKDVLGLPSDRVMEGTMGILAYQCDRTKMPIIPPTDAGKLSQASLAYRHVGKNPGFMAIKPPKRSARAFAELYNQCGVSRCAVMDAKLFATFASSIFVTMAMFDLAGWPDAATLARDEELMTLGARATKEVMRLSRHGVAGKLGSLLVSAKSLARTNAKMERDCLPVDYSAFNAFHHGGKVRQQDLAYLQACLNAGTREGRAMPALTELVRRYEAKISADD